MTTEAVLSDEIIVQLAYGRDAQPEITLMRLFARAIEQAVLNSPEVVAMRRDAERFRKLASHTYEIKRIHKRDAANRVRRLQLDFRNHTPSPAKWLEDAVDELDAAMEKQP